MPPHERRSIRHHTPDRRVQEDSTRDMNGMHNGRHRRRGLRRLDLERSRPATVLFDDVVDLFHQGNGLVESNDNLLIGRFRPD